MTDQERARRLDDATVFRLEQGSWRDPRDYLRDCAHCTKPFWVHGLAWSGRYCSPCCRTAAYLRRSGRGWTRPAAVA